MKAVRLPQIRRTPTRSPNTESLVRRVLQSADITVGGNQPGDIQVKKESEE